jgi:cysteine sulfinate desulfinase/cysteine desulfurase-like protein
MGCAPEVLHSAVRFSWSHLLSELDLHRATRHIISSVNDLRREEQEESPAAGKLGGFDT